MTFILTTVIEGAEQEVFRGRLAELRSWLDRPGAVVVRSKMNVLWSSVLGSPDFRVDGEAKLRIEEDWRKDAKVVAELDGESTRRFLFHVMELPCPELEVC